MEDTAENLQMDKSTYVYFTLYISYYSNFYSLYLQYNKCKESASLSLNHRFAPKPPSTCNVPHQLK